jgi:hypothetical protein
MRHFILFLSVVLFFTAGHALAQDVIQAETTVQAVAPLGDAVVDEAIPTLTEDVMAPEPDTAGISASLAEDVKTGDATVMEDKNADGFQRSTPENLAKLYWRLGVFDSGDDRAVDNFMLITECDLYQANVNNDFEWKKVREAAKTSLEIRRKSFPTKFEFLIPVELGNYDPELGGFPLQDAYAYNNVQRLEVVGNSIQRELCGTTGEIKDYPRNLMLILEKPFTYNFAKVDEHVAQAYIVRKQKEVMKHDVDVRQKRYKRTAYVRLRVDFNEYQGTIRGRNGVLLAIMKADLKGIDLFEDGQEVLLMSSSDAVDVSIDPNIPGGRAEPAPTSESVSP